jgi:uncharacterized repeat protein (TIGR02059 family)
LSGTTALAGSQAIVIDGVLPTISSSAITAGTKTLTLTMSETVTGAPAVGDFAVLVGGNTNTVTAISDVSSATNSVVLTLTSVIGNGAVVTVDYTQNSTGSKKLSDGAGNYLASVGDPIAVTVTDDNTAPTVSLITGTNNTYNTGDTVDLVVKLSEAVSVQGTPKLLLETGSTDRSAEYVSGSGGTDLLFRYTVQSGDQSGAGGLNYQSDTALNFGTDGMIKDLAQNTANLSLAALTSATNSLADDFDIIVSGV